MKRGSSWIRYITVRFALVDTRGRSAVTSILSTAGIAFGVMTLIVILSVMNGFQMGYIDSILEVSSYHVRLEGDPADIERAASLPGVRTVISFSENQVLVQGNYARQSGALLRGVPEDILDRDPLFAQSIEVQRGRFSLAGESSIVLGNELARQLGVQIGDSISIVAVSGSSERDLFPENADLTVQGTVKTGYYEIDSSFAYVSTETAKRFGGTDGNQAGVKLFDRNADTRFLGLLEQNIPGLRAESWRSFNRSFFGALRVEKNMLFVLVILIFLVVMVNIYHAMRRSVYERREEISILSALGGHPRAIQHIFMLNGFGIGLAGSVTGLLCGLFITVHINGVFSLAEGIVNFIGRFAESLLRLDSSGGFALFSPEYFYMQEIPVRMFFGEVFFVFVFGLFSATAAAWIASLKIATLKPAEVLRYE